MLAFLFNLLLFATETGGAGHSEGTWSQIVHFWEEYANYPGFEAWKFLNLAIFIAVMYYLLKTPLSEAFKARREAIRADLIKAEEEKQAALVKLAAAETKLARLDSESKNVLEKAKQEAEAEKNRIAEQTDFAVSKMREQADSEVERRRKQVRNELRRFSAEESIRLAEEKIKKAMDAKKDAQLVKAGIKSIGGLN
ncbi:MAG: ATP synthase F0 subunit B [Pyrinomonadaceae bacterium]